MGVELLAELRAVGLRVWLQDCNGRSGEFTIRVAPRQVLSDELRAWIALNREELIDLLYAEYWDRVFPDWRV